MHSLFFFGIIVSLIIIIVGVFLFLRLNQTISRVTQTDVSKIQNGYFHRSFTIKGKLNNTSKNDLYIYLDKYDGKVVAGNNKDIIAYINGLKSTFLHRPNIDWVKIPLRIIVTQENENIKVRLDESPGIKKIDPKIADTYNLKYEKAFDFHTDQIKAILKPT